MPSDNRFTWIKTHHGIVNYLKDKQDQQEELIELLKSVGAEGFNDRDAEGNVIPLSVIDPFTFFCYIYKYGQTKRLAILQKLAETLKLPIPQDTEGVPSVNAQKVWLFPYQYERNDSDEIDTLWELFYAIIDDQVTEDLFTRVKAIHNVGYAKLTEALFNVKPEKYLPVNGQTRSYLNRVLRISPQFTSLAEYKALLEEVKKQYPEPFYQISYEAYSWNTIVKSTAYWIFQGNPAMYDFESAIEKDVLESWAVKAHKDKISPGDKVIIWLTGEENGCYALAEVTSFPYPRTENEDDKYLKTEINTDELQVDIEITHNLFNDPILAEDIQDVSELANLNVGHRGTNFSATKEEYEAILRQIDKASSFEHVKRLFDKKVLDTYFTFLKEIIDHFQLRRGDPRIVFSIRPGRLNFTVGQRYCWNLFSTNKKGTYGIISKEKLKEDSESFEGAPPQPFYNHLEEFNLSQEQKNSVFKAIEKELRRTNKSGFLEYNDEDFAEYVFSQKSELKPMNNQYSLNSILYGPPGIGKTYHTTDLAVQIIKPDDYIEGDHAHNKLIFDDLVKQGRVVFTTFHQSTTYEDFIEGIKPVMSDDEAEDERGDITYKIENGLFKQLIEKIEDRKKIRQEEENNDFHIPKEKFDRQVNKVSLGDSTVEQDQAIYDYCMENNCVAIGFGEDIDFTGAKKLSEIRDRFKQAGIEVESANDFNVTAVNRLINWMEPGQLVMVPNGNRKIRAIGEVAGEYYCDPNTPIRYSQFRKVNWLYKDIDIPVKEVYPRRFSQMTIYHMNGSEFNTEFFSKNGSPVDYNEKFVMIIDEINRGNIAQIFGELITLLEEDKREGAANELSVKLPYSKSIFSIPSNLYLIGTMNTADRSVEALDTALRRRFAFEEMMPQPAIIEEVLKDKNEWEGIRISEVLAAINDRIEILVDRDHLIGHSYFLSLREVAREDMEEALIHIFVDKIIPLLQEYFYNDYVKIGMVLGKGFIKIKERRDLRFADFEEQLDADYTEKTIYHIYSRNELRENGFKNALHYLLNPS